MTLTYHDKLSLSSLAVDLTILFSLQIVTAGNGISDTG